MFDIGFTEIFLIGVVALIVIGPERLPAVAKTVGQYVGKLQRFVSGVKADFANELETGDLKKLIGDQKEQIDELRKMVSSTRQDLQSTAQSVMKTTREGLTELEHTVSDAKEGNPSESDSSSETLGSPSDSQHEAEPLQSPTAGLTQPETSRVEQIKANRNEHQTNNQP